MTAWLLNNIGVSQPITNNAHAQKIWGREYKSLFILALYLQILALASAFSFGSLTWWLLGRPASWVGAETCIQAAAIAGLTVMGYLWCHSMFRILVAPSGNFIIDAVSSHASPMRTIARMLPGVMFGTLLALTTFLVFVESKPVLGSLTAEKANAQWQQKVLWNAYLDKVGRTQASTPMTLQSDVDVRTVRDSLTQATATNRAGLMVTVSGMWSRHRPLMLTMLALCWWLYWVPGLIHMMARESALDKVHELESRLMLARRFAIEPGQSMTSTHGERASYRRDSFHGPKQALRAGKAVLKQHKDAVKDTSLLLVDRSYSSI